MSGKAKGVYAHKWASEVLEQVAYACNIAAKGQNTEDWQLFLQAIYDAINTLTYDQRIILLLSQEFAISYVDIARVLGKPISTIIGLLGAAINKIVAMTKARSLTNPGRFSCKAMQLIYDEQFVPQEHNHGAPDFEILDKYAPRNATRNYLSGGGGDENGEPAAQRRPKKSSKFKKVKRS